MSEHGEAHEPYEPPDQCEWQSQITDAIVDILRRYPSARIGSFWERRHQGARQLDLRFNALRAVVQEWSGDMTLYTLALFAHVLGVIGIFAGMGVWLFGIWALRQADRVEAIRLLTRLLAASSNLIVGAILLLGGAGFYMAITVWGVHATWIIVATINFVLLAPIGLLIIDPRVKTIAKVAHELPDGPQPEALALRARDPLLATALNVYIASLLGIVFIMTNKPALFTATLVALGAAALGLLASIPLWSAAAKRRVRTVRRQRERVR